MKDKVLSWGSTTQRKENGRTEGGSGAKSASEACSYLMAKKKHQTEK